MTKFKFSFYVEEDLLQECYIEAREALLKYDNDRPLDGFLYVHLRNRLSNIQRKITAKHSPLKKKILSPGSINEINVDNRVHVESDILEKLSKEELVEILNKELDADLRADFLKIASGVKITNSRLEKVKERISEILKKYEGDS